MSAQEEWAASGGVERVSWVMDMIEIRLSKAPKDQRPVLFHFPFVEPFSNRDILSVESYATAWVFVYGWMRQSVAFMRHSCLVMLRWTVAAARAR